MDEQELCDFITEKVLELKEGLLEDGQKLCDLICAEKLDLKKVLAEDKHELRELISVESLGIKTHLLTATGLITDRPCWLYSLVLVDNATTYSVFTIYDGLATTGKVIMAVSVPKYDTIVISLKSPIRCQKGLYIGFTTNGYRAFAQFRPDY